MSLTIDFTTGDFMLEERPAIVGQQVPPIRNGRLSESKVAALRAQARIAVRAGFTTRACRLAQGRGQIMMPNIDAMPSMTVTLAGRASSAPVDISCWTDAANRLSGAAYAAAKGG